MAKVLNENSFERKANSLQLGLWSVVFGLSTASLLSASCSCLEAYADALKVLAIAVCRIVQVLQVTDFWTKGSLIGKVLQISGRSFVALVVLPISPSLLYANLLMIVWAAGDIIRYNYYLNRDDFAGKLRYNVFFFNYPVGMALEIVNLLLAYKAGVLNPFFFNSVTVPLLVPFMLFGFQICFRQLFGQRKLYYSEKIKTQ